MRILKVVLATIRALVASRATLVAENLALRHQLSVLAVVSGLADVWQLHWKETIS